jgi:hypothetical protein
MRCEGQNILREKVMYVDDAIYVVDVTPSLGMNKRRFAHH